MVLVPMSIMVGAWAVEGRYDTTSSDASADEGSASRLNKEEEIVEKD